MASSAILSIKILADAAKAQKALDQTGDKAGGFAKGISKAGAIAGGALLAVGAGAIFAGKAAADDAKSQALMANAMKKSAGATKDQVAATEEFIDKTARATGVADDELRPAMSTLVRATGDVEKAQSDLTRAMDISAATGKPLQSVSEAIAKGYGGTTTSLGRLVPGIDKAVLASGDMTKIMDELAKKTGGSAAAAANTAAGKMDRMKVASDEAVESIGGAMLPVLDLAATLLNKVATFAGKNAKTIQILAGVVIVLAAAIWTLSTAMKLYNLYLEITKVLQTATWASALGPILLVVAAIALVVGIFVLLYKKSDRFRSLVDKIWSGIKTGARVAAQIFKTVWNAAIKGVQDYIRVMVAYFKTVFAVIRGLVKIVVSVFKGDWRGALDAVKDILRSFKDFFRTLFSTTLGGVIKDLATKIKDGLRDAIQAVKDKLDNVGSALAKPWETMKSAIDKVVDVVEDLIGWLGKVKIPSGISSIIGKVTGRSVSAATPAGKSTGVTSLAAARTRSSSSSSSGPTITVNGALDPEAVARQIQRILRGHQGRVGLATR